MGTSQYLKLDALQQTVEQLQAENKQLKKQLAQAHVPAPESPLQEQRRLRTELRAHPFDALRAPNNETDPTAIARAQAVSSAAQTSINSVKVELEQQKLTGSAGTEFLPRPAEDERPSGTTLIPTQYGTKRVTTSLGGSTTIHKMRG